MGWKEGTGRVVASVNGCVDVCVRLCYEDRLFGERGSIFDNSKPCYGFN
jgi:hypothetical protein